VVFEAEREHRKRSKSGNPGSDQEIPEVVVTEIGDGITAYIPGVRATAELTRLRQSEAAKFGLEPDVWFWLNRLINQSGIPRVGTLLLDEVLEHCGRRGYSIMLLVSAYGDISQQDLENWYMRKGFTPIDYESYGNASLEWTPRRET